MADDTGFRQSLAVVVGIDRYREGIPPLRSAVNDARRLAEVLAQAHGYRCLLLLDEQATRAGILSLIDQQLPEQVGAEDRVLFYFAGHGVALGGDEGPQGFLLPQDAERGVAESYLDMARLHDGLLALPCRHMLVILDSCFSGAFRWSGRRDAVLDLPPVYQERYERFLRDPAWQLITSAAHDQTAADAWRLDALGARDAGGPHSPFAEALLDALGGAADLVPKDGDGVITATELFVFLEDRLQPQSLRYALRQTPGLWPLAKHDKGEFVFLVPGRQRQLPPAPALNRESNPYRGLAGFESQHAALFFGREPVIDELLQRITSDLLTVVLGASGTGKSSVVKAGVMPRLAADADWAVLPLMRPGSDPLAALRAALGELAGGADGGDSAAQAARWGTSSRRHLLVIDQFEELHTTTRSAEQRAAFLQQLADLLSAAGGRLHVVLTLRSDFEGLFRPSPLEALWQSGRYVVPAMSRADFRAAIEGPAVARVLYFEPSSLVEQLVDEVAAMPGGLPLLSFTLSEMYLGYLARGGDDRCLTRHDYDALGGVVGALRARADAELAALDTAHQATLRRLMLRMLRVQHGILVRQRVSEAQLRSKHAAETVRLNSVLERFIDARLVVRGVDDRGEPFVEPAHDALVTAWGSLLDWAHRAQEEEPDLAFLHALQRTAEEWASAGATQRPGLLWRDKLRSRRLWWLQQRAPAQLSQTEDAFCQASIARWRMLRNLSIAAVTALALTALLASALGLIAVERRDQAEARRLEAEQQTRLAQANALSAAARGAIDGEGNPTLGFKLAAQALALQPSHEGALWLLRRAAFGSGFFIDRGAVISTPFAHKLADKAASASWSPDGRHVAIWQFAGEDGGSGILRILASDGQPRSATPVAASFGGQFDASGNYVLWTEEPLALDLDGQRVSAAKWAALDPWHASGRTLVYEGETGIPWYLASSEDGRVRAGVLQAADEEGFDASSMAERLDFGIEVAGEAMQLIGACDGCNQVALRADGSLIATASWDGEVALWKVNQAWAQAQRIAVLRPAGGGEFQAQHLAFSPDGSRLLLHDWRGDVWMWQIGWLRAGQGADLRPTDEGRPAQSSTFTISVERSGLSADTPHAELTCTEQSSGRSWRRVFVTSTVEAAIAGDLITLITDDRVFLLSARGTQSLELSLERGDWSPVADAEDLSHPLRSLYRHDAVQPALALPLSAEALIGVAGAAGFLDISAEDQRRWSVEEIISASKSSVVEAVEDTAWAALWRRLGLTPAVTPSVTPDPADAVSEPVLPAPWQVLQAATPTPPEPLDAYVPQPELRWFVQAMHQARLPAALQTLSPPPRFLGGPHPAGGLDLYSEDFGRYNPAFIAWIEQTLLPSACDDRLRAATQPAFDLHLRRFARLFAVARAWLDERQGWVDSLLAAYPAQPSERGRFLLDTLTAELETQPPFDEGEAAELAMAAGFWIRRELDGTAQDFERALQRVLSCYDPGFRRSMLVASKD